MSASTDKSYSPGAPAVTDKLIVHGRDVQQRTVYSWARNGHMHSAWPGENKEIPYDATEIKVKLIAFPGGTVREIYLAKGARTHPHGSYEVVLFYQIDGRRVQVAKERSFEVNPGDATFEPAGIEHSTHQLIGGLFMEFALPAPMTPDAEAVWIRSSEAERTEVAEWMDGDKVVRVTGREAAAAPRNTSRYTRKTYALPGHPMIETTLAKGAAMLPRVDALDNLFYLVKGRMKATLADTTDEVVAGDAMRSVAGRSYGFTALEDSVLIQAAVPR